MPKAAKTRPKPAKAAPPVRFDLQPWLAGGLLVLITLIAYAPAFAAGFIWDDPDYVVHNITLRSIGGLWQMWTSPTSLPQWYPLVHTTFWIEYHIWELWSPGYHIVNILLHAAGALLLWRLLIRLEIPAAWLAAAMFAVHPIHVESVAWITERKNTLSAFFYFASAIAYLKSRTKAPHVHAGLRWYFASLTLFLAAMFSKTVACSLPAAILLITWWKTGRITWRDIRPLLPMFAIGLALGMVTAHLERTHVGATGRFWTFAATPGGEFVARSLIAGRAIWFYAGKLIFPWPLAFMYERWHIDLHDRIQYVWPVTAAIVVIMLFMLRRQFGRGPIVAVLFFIGTLFPALGYFNIYPMQFSFVADHFQHLASIGLTTLAAIAIHRISQRKPAVGYAIVLAPLVVLSMHQCLSYMDAETLWRDTMAKTPNSWMVYTNLGRVLESEGRPLEAIPFHERALALEPTIKDTHYNVAVGRMMQGKVDETASKFSEAEVKFSQAEAGFKDAIAIAPNFSPPYVDLGKLEFFHRHNPAAAEAYFKKALEVTPTYAPAHYAYGILLERAGNMQGAVEHYKAAVADYDDDFDSQYDLGCALLKLNRPAEAVAPFRQAVRIVPDSRRAWTNLAAALRFSGDQDGALDAGREAMRATRE